MELGSEWPPAGIDAINPLIVPLLNTALLISSGATVTYAHHSFFTGDRSAAILGMMLTLLLAVLFTALQGFEYAVSPFTIADGAFGSTFFFATGFHGYHAHAARLTATVASPPVQVAATMAIALT